MTKPSVLISGASSGLGEATARRLAKRGWTVFAGVRSPNDAARLRRLYHDVRPVILDVTSDVDLRRAAETISDVVGDTGLQGLVNNAGLGYMAPLECIPLADFRHNFEVNLFGVLGLTQAVLPLLRGSSPSGRIVNVGSIAGLCTLPYAASYFASKHALEALNDSMRHEFRPSGVKVSLVRPGPFNTAIFKKGAEYGTALLERQADSIDSAAVAGTEALMKAGVRTGAASPSAERVVDVIEVALTCPFPRAHYFDAWHTAIQIQAINLIPTAVLDKFYERFFHT